MKISLFAVFSLVIILFAAPLYAVDMQEGEWETITEMVMEGMPFSMPPTKMRQCITKKDLVPKGEEDKNCVFKEQKATGNTVRWTVVCKDKDSTSEGKGEIIYSGRNYRGSIQMTVTEKGSAPDRITMKISGKYLGPCTKETIAAEKEMKKQISEAEAGAKKGMKEGEAMMKEAEARMAQNKKDEEARIAQMKKDEEENRRRAETIIAKVRVPDESADACIFYEDYPERNKKCDSKMGELNLKAGKWETFSEKAARRHTQSKDHNVQEFSTVKATSGIVCLTREWPLYGVGSEDKREPALCGGGRQIAIKRSGNKLTWKYQCSGAVTDGSAITEGKGGVTFSGDSYEGGIIVKTSTKADWDSSTKTEYTYTSLSGRLIDGRLIDGRFSDERFSDDAGGRCAGRAFTTTVERSRTSGKETEKDAAENPVKSIKKLFGW